MKLRSDSEGAGNIARMTGLLRRVRHLELRVAYLQENIEAGRASVTFVPGAYNGADVLTKIPAKKQLEYFHDDIGLAFPEEVKALTHETHMLFEDLKHLSSRNRSQVIQSVGKILGRLSALGWKWTQRSKAEIEDPGSVPANVGSVEPICLNPKEKRVSFSEKEEVFAIPRRLSKELNTFLKKEKRFEAWREPLTMMFAGCETVFIEICCQEGSSLEEEARRKGMAYFGVTQKIDVTYSRTIWLLRQVIRKAPKAYIHISSPCTSGSKIRYLNFSKYPNSFSKWQSQFRLHRKIWTAIRKTLKDFSKKEKVLISQEWPRDCDLFKELVYVRSQKQIDLIYSALVKRCCVDGIRKDWKFRTNNPELALNLTTPLCRCQSPEISRITASGFYSPKVAQHVIEAFLGVRI